MLDETKPTIFTCAHQPCHVCELWLWSYIPARNFNVSFSISCSSHNLWQFSFHFSCSWFWSHFTESTVLYKYLCFFCFYFLSIFSTSVPVRVWRLPTACTYSSQWNSIYNNAELFVSDCYSKSIAMSFFMFIHALCYGKPTTQTC